MTISDHGTPKRIVFTHKVLDDELDCKDIPMQVGILDKLIKTW